MAVEEISGEDSLMLGPLLLIALGVLFLLNNLYPDVARFSRMWPVILIVIGLAKILEYFRRTSGKGEDHEPNP
jgi:hypothetical protein